MEIGQFVYMSHGGLVVPRQAVAACVISSRVRATAAGSQSVLQRFGGQMIHHALSVRLIPALVLHQIGKSDAALIAVPPIANGARLEKLDEERPRHVERMCVSACRLELAERASRVLSSRCRESREYHAARNSLSDMCSPACLIILRMVSLRSVRWRGIAIVAPFCVRHTS